MSGGGVKIKFPCGCVERWESENPYEYLFAGKCDRCGTQCCFQCGYGDEGSSEELWTDRYQICSQCNARSMYEYERYSFNASNPS